jgi:hypothetical protein
LLRGMGDAGGVMFFIPARDAFRFMVYPTLEVRIKPAQYIQRHRVGSEGLYICYGAYPTFKYYALNTIWRMVMCSLGKQRASHGRYQVELDSITEKGMCGFIRSQLPLV